jgi:chitinase
MSVVIQGVQFDYLWIQFYNNNNYTVPCSLGINGGAAFNYNNWTSYIASTPSKGAKLFVGKFLVLEKLPYHLSSL